VDSEMAQLLREANFKFLEIGLQSTNRSVLKLVNRRNDTVRFKKGIEYLKNNDLPVEIHIIYGLPGENLSSFFKSLDDTYALQPDTLSPFKLMALPGTEIWHKAKEYGLIFEEEPNHYIIKSDTFSEEDVKKHGKINEGIKILLTKWITRCLMNDFKIKFSDLIVFWSDLMKDEKIDGGFPKEKHLELFLNRLSSKLGKNIDTRFYSSLISKEFPTRDLAV